MDIISCPSCHSKGTLQVWNDNTDVTYEDDTVHRMVRCSRELCDFTSREPRHIVMIERYALQSPTQVDPLAASSILPFKPSPLLSGQCTDKTRRKVEGVTNRVCEQIERICALADLQMCGTMACDNFRFLGSQFSISKNNSIYAVVACLFFAWTSARHVATVDASVSMAIGQAVDDVFQCSNKKPDSTLPRRPYSVREHARKHINKFLGVLKTRRTLGTIQSVEPIQYCKDVVAIFRTCAGSRLAFAGVGHKRAREEGDVVLVEARGIAKKVTERIDSSLDIPSGCKTTICLSIAAHAVASKLTPDDPKRLLVEETAREIATEKGVQESFNRRFKEIGRLVDKFSR